MLASTFACALVVLASAGAARANDVLTFQPLLQSGRGEVAFAADTRHNHLIVFGGYIAHNALSHEVHALDLAQPYAWTLPDVTGPPPPSTGLETAVYDSLHDRFVVFSNDSPAVSVLPLSGAMTWQAPAIGGTQPALGACAVVYDPVRDRIVGFGGYDAAGNTTGATWTLRPDAGATWTPLAVAGGAPPTRAAAGAVYDPIGDRMLVFGGRTVDALGPRMRSDLWQLSFAGGTPTWSLVPTLGTPPSARRSASVVFDVAAHRLVVFGGLADGPLNDTWVLPLDSPTPTWQFLATGIPTPDARYGAAAALDPSQRHMIVAGGRTYTTNDPDADAWQLALDVASPRWSPLPVRGSLLAQSLGFEPLTDRFFGNGRVPGSYLPAFLSPDDLEWAPIPSPEWALSDQTPAPWWAYDGPRNTLLAIGPTAVYSIVPGPGATWTSMPCAGTPPPSVYLGTTAYDPARQRFLVIGGQTGTPPIGVTGFWLLDLTPTPTWRKVADTTPLGARRTQAMWDTRRDRLLFFGGEQIVGGNPVALGDLWALDLTALQWSSVSVVGAPPSPRYEFACAYDSTRDRIVIFGGGSYAQPQPGAWYLQFNDEGAPARWFRNDPTGAPLPAWFDQPSGYDRAHDALVTLLPSSTTNEEGLYSLAFGPAVTDLAVTCPAPTAWAPGQVLDLHYRIDQGVNTISHLTWRIDSDRAWPGFPLLGQQDVSGPTSVDVPVGIPVPDTAAAGVDTLRFRVDDPADPSRGAACASVIVSPTPAPPRALAVVCPDDHPWVSGVPNIVRFGLEQSAAGPHTYLWSVSSARAWPGFPLSGLTTVDDAGAVALDVNVAVPDSAAGGSNALTITVYDTSDPGQQDSCRTRLSSIGNPPPGGLRLAIGARGALVVRGAFDVPFSVPGAGMARLDAYDLRGRRVAKASLDAPQAQEYVLRLAGAGTLRPGVYFLRLTQGPASVQGRALVLGSR